MKIKEFITEDESKKIKFIENPFPQSELKDIVYHGTDEKFDMFEKWAHGTFVARRQKYVELYYGEAIPLYVDIRNLLPIEEAGYYHPAIDAAFDRDYKKLAVELDKLKKEGYDSIEIGGDGDSVILFGDDVKIVNAITGKRML